MHDECLELAQQAARLDRSAADGDDARLAPAANVLHEPRFELAKRGLSLSLEQFPDRAVRVLDLAIHVVEGPSEPARDLRAHRRLPRAHETDQRKMTS